MQYDDVKYASFCGHDFHKSLTNEIELPCLDHPQLIHRISQCGKICNKCTHIIKDSYKQVKNCLVCSGELEEYVRDRELCQHQNRQFQDVIVKCLNDNQKNHQVPFRTKICKRCSDKIRATFMNSNGCKICEGKEEEVIRDMEKTYISSAYSYFKAVINTLREAKAPDQIFKNEIQSACKSEPLAPRAGSPFIDKELIAEYESTDSLDNHQSKRYKLYPKCRKHKQCQINVCNNCLVALLNIDSCPYGCVEEAKTQKAKTDKLTKVSQTAFLHLYPLPIGQTCYLELFVLKLIEERGRMDRWESKITRVSPKSDFEINFAPKFPLFYSAVPVTNREFLVCGGAVGRNISEMKQTNQAFVVSLSQSLKEYSIIAIESMNEARSGHALVYHQKRQLVFAIGGFVAGDSFSRGAEVYSIQHKKWFKLKDLHIERSKPTAFCYQDQIYVMGGLTANQGIIDTMAERFNFETESWDKITYDGFDYPSVTSCTASASIPIFQNKSPLLLFGGSNTSDMVPFIQPVNIGPDSKEFGLNHLKNINEMKNARLSPVLGLIKEDTLVCFGGVEECEHFLNIQGFTLKTTEKEVSIYAPLDDITIGSYRLILRQDSKLTYKRLYDLLEKQGFLSPSKMSKHQDRAIATSFNNHLIERLWYTTGKSFVWVPI